MKTHTIALVCFIAAALAVAAIMVTSRRTPGPAGTEGLDAPVLPALGAKINDVAEVRIVRSAGTFTFRRGERGWGLAEKDGFPVKSENIRALLIGLAELRTVEAKTGNPELYAKIGVQEPGGGESAAAGTEQATQPTLVTVIDSAGGTLGSVIIGTQKWGTVPEVYIRRSGESQSWLASGRGGRVDVPWDALAWVDRSILNVPRDKWKSVTVIHPDGERVGVLKADASQANFFVEGIPEGRELTSPTAGESLGGVFAALTLDDVRSASTFDAEALSSTPRITGTTFEGLIVTARIIEQDGKQWAVVEAAADKPDESPEAAKQAGEVNARLAGWAFAIPQFKAKAMLTRWNDVLKPQIAPEAAPATDPGQADPAGETPAEPG